MEQEKQHILKQISGWHYVYVIIILILSIVGLVSYRFSNCDSLVTLISFAATISSIILSVLAIFMTVLSGESMNKLRDSLIGLTSIPGDVKLAVSSTIDDMKKYSEELNKATEANTENIENYNRAVETKMLDLESHVLKRLDMHQESTLKAINGASLNNTQGKDVSNGEISDDIINRFISTTSNLSLAFLYIVGQYCKKNESLGKTIYPIVNLDDITPVVNGGDKDESLSMYFLACLVLLSSFGLLDYEMSGNQHLEITLKSLNETLYEKVLEEFKKRQLPSPAEGLDQYVDSLFKIKEEDNDGSEAN